MEDTSCNSTTTTTTNNNSNNNTIIYKMQSTNFKSWICWVITIL